MQCHYVIAQYNKHQKSIYRCTAESSLGLNYSVNMGGPMRTIRQWIIFSRMNQCNMIPSCKINYTTHWWQMYKEKLIPEKLIFPPDNWIEHLERRIVITTLHQLFQALEFCCLPTQWKRGESITLANSSDQIKLPKNAF